MTMAATASAMSAKIRIAVVNCWVKCTAESASEVASWLPVWTWYPFRPGSARIRATRAAWETPGAARATTWS
jgi:hypothetical protein